MTFRDDLDLYAPRLRRYARGLVAGRPAAAELAEDLVQATFARRNRIDLVARWLDPEVGLYALVTRLHRDAVRTGSIGASHTIESGHFCTGGAARPERAVGPSSPVDRISAALYALPVEEREALLLVAVEGFSYARSARILRISRRVLIARLSRARTTVSQFLHEPLPMRPGNIRPAHLRLVE